MIGVWAKNCPQWMMTDIACAYGGCTVVPIYPTETVEQARVAEIRTVCTTEENVNSLVELRKEGKAEFLEKVVIYGNMEDK